MFTFFNIEKRIGLKKLSSADLGTSSTSNQTHIGLSDEVLTFWEDSTSTKAMLIHDSYCQILDCFFDRIENPDGTFRSPKIRMGTNNSDSVVSKIRKFAEERPNDDWYLLWSSLENKDSVFWLINKSSADFHIIESFVNANIRINIHIIKERDSAYEPLKLAMVKKINSVSVDIQKEIEIISQVGDLDRKFKAYDVEKASKQFAAIGKKGEELINEYLGHELAANRICSFEWMNKSRESGLPYDFVIQSVSSVKQFIDVKSTRFDFKQSIIFSSQEIAFVQNCLTIEETGYTVYRVFNMVENSGLFSICNDCKNYMNNINADIERFKERITSTKTTLLKMSLSVSPEDCFSSINAPIKLQ